MYDSLPNDDNLYVDVEDLKEKLDFTNARILLSRKNSEYPDDVKIIQQLALCTYKDEELPPHTRFDEALCCGQVISDT